MDCHLDNLKFFCYYCNEFTSEDDNQEAIDFGELECLHAEECSANDCVRIFHFAKHHWDERDRINLGYEKATSVSRIRKEYGKRLMRIDDEQSESSGNDEQSESSESSESSGDDDESSGDDEQSESSESSGDDEQIESSGNDKQIESNGQIESSGNDKQIESSEQIESSKQIESSEQLTDNF